MSRAIIVAVNGVYQQINDAVNQWLDEHDMTYRWAGEHTHEHNGVVTYGYDVKIVSGGKHRTFFKLKWS